MGLKIQQFTVVEIVFDKPKIEFCEYKKIRRKDVSISDDLHRLWKRQIGCV